MVNSINYKQGTIIKPEGMNECCLIVSHDLFNQTEQVYVCPIKKKVTEDPLHIWIETNDIKGYVLCEHIHKLDLKYRGFQLKSEVNVKDMIEVSDTIQALFDYGIR